MTTIRCDEYTGQWQAALQPEPTLEEGDIIERAQEPDAREWDDLRATAERCGLRLEWSDYDEDDRVDTYEAVAGA